MTLWPGWGKKRAKRPPLFSTGACFVLYCIVLYVRLFEFCIRYTVVVPISLVQGMMSILITLGRCFTSHNNELRMIRDQHAEEMRVAREQMRNEITAEVRRDLAREKVKMKYVFHSFLF